MTLPRPLRLFLLTLRDLLLTVGPVLILAVAGVWFAYKWLNPTPPKRVVMITGPEQSGYAALGQQYRTELARHGVELVLKESGGSLDNFRALVGVPGEDRADDAPSFGFVQGGSFDPRDEEDQSLQALGSLFYEPVWLFYRADAVRKSAAYTHNQRREHADAADALPMSRKTLDNLVQLQGLTVNVGPEGSGGPKLFANLMAANRLKPESIQLKGLAPTPAVVALLDGEIDALLMVSAPESALVQMLLATPNIRLLDMVHAEAYARRFPFLSHVTLPRGIVEPSRDLPGRPMQMIAPTATLVARDDTHPALVQLMVQAAAEIHGRPGWFVRQGEFPSAKYNELPVAAEAKRFYTSGPPWAQRWAPFWIANLFDRMWVVLAALLAILIPLSRVVPPIYQFRVRSRIFRWYGKLREIEDRLAAEPPLTPDDRQQLLQQLDDIDSKVEHVSVPLSYAEELYALRSYIHWVKARVQGRPWATQAAPGPDSAAARA